MPTKAMKKSMERRIVGMILDVTNGLLLGRWIRDEEHKNKPTWATHPTPMGWSDSKHGSEGQNSFVGFAERLKKRLGGKMEVKVATEKKIPIILGKIQDDLAKEIEAAPEDKKEEMYESTKNSMRIDVAIEARDKRDFPFPVFVEVDGKQHESNRQRSNSSENHLDRIKDFCARLNKRGILVRVKSNANSSQRTEFIYGKLKEYYDRLAGDGDMAESTLFERRKKLQEFADAMCFKYAEKGAKDELSIGNPDDFVKQVKKEIVSKALTGKGERKGFSAEQVKLMNIWTRERKSLAGFVRTLKEVAGEKDAANHHVYKGTRYAPYTFMEDILKKYRSERA